MQDYVNTIRMLSIDMVQKANSGHPGLPLDAAPMAFVLWTKFLKHNPANPNWYDRDRFVLSAGHGSALLYSLLHLTGYAVSMDDIKNFRQWESITPGHPEYRLTPGVEITTGPLGQGFGNGVGMAMAEAYLAAKYNRPGYNIINHHTYGIVSDGDLMEGIASEAASLAGHLKLGKLIYLYDSNNITLSASTQLAFTEDVDARFKAYGWHTCIVKDGNDLVGIQKAIENARAEKDRPSLIIVKTHIGYGSPHKHDTFEAHGSPLGEEEVKLTKQNLGWPSDKKFYVPGDAKKYFRQALTEGSKSEKKWKAAFSAYAKAHPVSAKELSACIKGELKNGWDKNIPTFPADAKGISTRVASGKVMQAVNPSLPGLIGGSADLNPSTFTELHDYGTFQNKDMKTGDLQGSIEGGWNYAGRNIFYGVREHAMGSISNGLATFGGIIPYTATFLTFSDYMRPAIRLAALMKLQVVFVFTHDSIGLGEDGPTHQPIEQLAALRAIPGLIVLRPGDANETAVAWQIAIEARDRPCALILSRQSLPTLDRKIYASAEGVRRGAYILQKSFKAKPDIILIATGSELSLVIEAAEKLKRKNISAQVVSMPSWELFELQPKKYRDLVFPASVKKRLAVEAGVSQGWEKYIGEQGDIISIEKFGKSAPGPIVMEHYGFTVKNILKKEHSMSTNPLITLEAFGQSIWLDDIQHSLMASGRLKQYIEKDGLAGITSNPSIFEKAIAESHDYDEDIYHLVQQGKDTQSIYQVLTVKDVQMAADEFLPLFQRKKGRDGLVSLEVNPHLAHDTDGTIQEARQLWTLLNRPNVLIKVPATKEGIPAIEQLISEGINVNVTLLFGLPRYQEVVQAYISGLEKRLYSGEPIDSIVSVASFFLSRIDVLIDPKLEKFPDSGIQGEVAIASAKKAYQIFSEMFQSARFKKLIKHGAHVQRLLWASTSTKNPAYSDVKYVEELIGPDTVNTLPLETLNAYRDHGNPEERLDDRIEQADEVFQKLGECGIDIDDMTQQLEDEGVQKFETAYDKLISAIKQKEKA